MCGRFGLLRGRGELAEEFSHLEPEFEVDEIRPRYNIAPTQPVLTLRVDGNRVRAGHLRWGISLPWAGERRLSQLINVRAETALRPGWFRGLLERHRALLPASHFYEWRTLPGRRRQPMLIGPTQGEGLVFAGLLGRWTDRASGEIVPAVTILTTQANQVLRPIHDRMPVILPPTSWARWLDSGTGADEVADLLMPCPDEWLSTRPISSLVNDVANDGPALIEPPGTELAREAGDQRS
ncbi:MAG TPA: SOS response-associated peptidase [Candidatus Dormibacteraeota bacterium]|nr:SOS response-associated peptidase [Candidatus Dormibacteraeota bacterium]